jgi:hypothetical protein
MKIKVYYDGNPANTRVVDQATNETVEGVISAHVDIDVTEALCTLVIADFEADITNAEVRDEDPEWLHRETSDRDNRTNS